jgi:glycine dehydrogenase subunit 2
MKYSPKVNDRLAALPYLRYAHPLQPEATIQGILKILYELRSWFCEISGMDEFSFQPRGGSHGVHANARIIQAYHQANGDMTRDEMITCAVSHPCNAGCPSSIGYKIIELYPEKDTGDIGLEKFKSVVSDRTAGLMITAPYDTGVFDSQLSKYIDLVHEAGGLVALDQANYNGVMTRLRAGDVGADLMHFNLHKTFSTPHGSFGPGSGAIGAKEHLRSFMPVPIVEFNGQDYHLNYNLTQSIGSIGSFYGVVMNAVRAYAWIMSMGAQGLREASDWAVINNNYLIKKLLEVRGLEISWPNRRKLQEARFSLQKLKEETGIGTNEFNRRIADYGIQTYVTSHYPVIIPEPVTPEPSESTSREDIDHFVDIFHRISDEAYSNPEIIKTAPHRCSIHQMDEEVFQDIDQATVTWQAYAKKKGLA